MNFPKYPSIDNLNHSVDVLNHECVVTEKLHGTNARLMLSSDKGLVLGSRNDVLYHDGQKVKELYGFVEWVLSKNIETKLNALPKVKDFVFYGEFFGSNIQKGIKYCEEKDFSVFDVLDPSGAFLEWKDVVCLCQTLGFKTVPVIHVGRVDVAWLQSIRDNTSVVGAAYSNNDPNNTWEGVVIKPLVNVFDKHGNRIIAKYKSNKWAENANCTKTKDVNPETVEIRKQAEIFAQTVVTQGRVATIIDHITRDGNQELSMKRTGEFLKEFVHDVAKEHKEVYEKLDKIQQNFYNKAISSLASLAWKKEVEKK